jgi:hypothetical protein
VPPAEGGMGWTSLIFYIPQIILPTLKVVLFSTTTFWELTLALTILYSTSLHFLSLNFQSPFPCNLVYCEQRTGPILQTYLNLHSKDILITFSLFPTNLGGLGGGSGGLL